MHLFENDPEWVSYYLYNLRATKKLHDRGFDVSPITCFGDHILTEFLDILFGEKNVLWESYTPATPKCYNPKDDYGHDWNEESFQYSVEDYLERSHFTINIRLPQMDNLHGYLLKRDYKRLLKALQCAVHPADENSDYYFDPHELFEDVRWIKSDDGQVVGIAYHFVEVPTWYEGDYPYYLQDLYDSLISFWDLLKKHEKGAKVCNGRCVRKYQPSNKKRRLCLYRRGRPNKKREADKPTIAA